MSPPKRQQNYPYARGAKTKEQGQYNLEFALYCSICKDQGTYEAFELYLLPAYAYDYLLRGNINFITNTKSPLDDHTVACLEI
jgi:hypothetical protein